jgi:tRNA 2-thiouridine synthesizing protein A
MTPEKLDVRGEICPYPMMRTVSALKKLARDKSALEVVTDHAPALETIPTQAARLGFRTDIEETGASEWRITITRSRVEEEA